jgi:cysteine desulfurase / selenocysteine lyase
MVIANTALTQLHGEFTAEASRFANANACAIAPAKEVSSAALLQHTEIEKIRRQFPILTNNPEKIFFDNASTSQKPSSVLETMRTFHEFDCSNAGRGSYSWSTKLSSAVEQTRQSLASYLNTVPEQLAFTSGATDSLNLIAQCWGLNNLQDGDEVMVCMEDHRSSVLPWINLQQILQRFGKQIRIVPFTIHPSGTYDRKSIAEGLSERTRLISLSHIHHVYGMEMDVAELKALIPNSVMVSLDCSQSIGHIGIDVSALKVDFVSFSGHKMFAANGVGGLWASRRAIETLWPLRVGAKTKISETDTGLEADRSSLAGLIECGTLNLSGILSLNAAVSFMKNIGISHSANYISYLTKYLVSKLKCVPGIEFAPGIGACDCTKGFGIISFRFCELRTADVGAYLDTEDIFVRTGDHCQARESNGTAGDDYLRISLQIYNTMEEIDHFVEVLQDACC